MNICMTFLKGIYLHTIAPLYTVGYALLSILLYIVADGVLLHKFETIEVRQVPHI